MYAYEATGDKHGGVKCVDVCSSCRRALSAASRASLPIMVHHTFSSVPLGSLGDTGICVYVCISVCGEGGERKARGAGSVIKHAPHLTVRP